MGRAKNWHSTPPGCEDQEIHDAIRPVWPSILEDRNGVHYTSSDCRVGVDIENLILYRALLEPLLRLDPR
eukprot:6281426-Pyramimonas_sp.AAC.1